MGAPQSPEALELMRMLGDYEWHFAEEVLNSLVSRVAPGRAIRKYEQGEDNRAKHHGPRVTAPLSDEEKIRSGARVLAAGALKTLQLRYIETDDQGDARLVRLRRVPLPMKGRTVHTNPQGNPLGVPRAPSERSQPPEEPEDEPAEDDGFADDYAGFCGVCGLRIADEALHKDWHREQRASRLAVPRDVDVEELIRGIVQEELDSFQKGLEGWLMTRFDYLEQTLGSRRPAPAGRYFTS